MKKTLMGLLLSVMLTVFVSGQALASTASVTSYLDLSSLQSMDFTWVVSSQTSANASNNLPESASAANNGAGWSAPTSTAAVTAATSTGTAVNGVYTSTASAFLPSYIIPKSTSLAGEGAVTSGTINFTYYGTSTTGYVDFVIPYSVAVNLLASNPGLAYGYYEVMISITTSLYNEKKVAQSNTTINGGSFTYNENGDFVFSVPLSYGETGTIEFMTIATVKATSVVPLPAGLWLLGSGLVGLVGIRRKKA